MYFSFAVQNFAAILEHYDRYGFVVLTDVDRRLAAVLRRIVSARSGMSEEEIIRVKMSTQA